MPVKNCKRSMLNGGELRAGCFPDLSQKNCKRPMIVNHDYRVSAEGFFLIAALLVGLFKLARSA